MIIDILKRAKRGLVLHNKLIHLKCVDLRQCTDSISSRGAVKRRAERLSFHRDFASWKLQPSSFFFPLYPVEGCINRSPSGCFALARWGRPFAPENAAKTNGDASYRLHRRRSVRWAVDYSYLWHITRFLSVEHYNLLRIYSDALLSIEHDIILRVEHDISLRASTIPKHLNRIIFTFGIFFRFWSKTYVNKYSVFNPKGKASNPYNLRDCHHTS